MPELALAQATIGLNQPALDEWIDYRREVWKKPMSPRAIAMVTKKLLQWSEDEQLRMIENAIEMEWKGVYWVDPPKVQGQVSTRDSTLEQDLNSRDWAK